MQREEFPSVDYIKAAAIVAVVMSHAVLPVWDPRHTPVDLMLGAKWTAYHVPSFLALSGFLYWSAEPVPLATVGRRLLRLLLPYLVVSVVIWQAGLLPDTEKRSALVLVMTGGTSGIFYYVFVAAILTPLIWPLSRTPLLLVIVLLGLYPVLITEFPSLRFGRPELYVSLRNPFYYVVYFLGGWYARKHLQAFATSFSRKSLGWLTTGIALISFHFIDPLAMLGWGKISATLMNRMIYTMGVVIVIVWCAERIAKRPALQRTLGRGVGFVSATTYTIFLYHFFVIHALRPILASWSPALRIMVTAVAALIGSALVAALGRRFLPERSQWILGA